MDERTAFDATPDPELGTLLREVLETGDRRALVARIVAQFDARRIRQRPFVEILGDWGRAGAVAAAVAATLALYFALPRTAPAPAPTLLEATLSESPSQQPAAALVSSSQPPDPNMVFAASFEP